MKRYKTKIISAACLILFLGVFAFREAELARAERAVFCDVGQGDAAVLALDKTQIVIDGGPNKSVMACLGRYMPYFDRRIEYLIISHPDKDHFVGAVEILKRYDVGAVITNGESDASPEYAEFFRLAEEKIMPAEDFEIAGAKLDFFEKEKMKEQNDNSLVFKFSYAGVGILFTGDISEKGESALLREDLKADILKIAHHGSKESSSPEFLQAVSPEVAVISVGADNKYGHPAYKILKRLENLGIKYMRTDESGDIVANLE